LYSDVRYQYLSGKDASSNLSGITKVDLSLYIYIGEALVFSGITKLVMPTYKVCNIHRY